MNFIWEEKKLSQRTRERKVVIVEVFEAICSLRIVNFSCKLLMIEQFKCWLLLLEINRVCRQQQRRRAASSLFGPWPTARFSGLLCTEIPSENGLKLGLRDIMVSLRRQRSSWDKLRGLRSSRSNLRDQGSEVHSRGASISEA